MYLSINSLQTNALYFKEQIFSSLTSQQKKTLLVAALALSCLAAIYFYFKCCFKASSVKTGEIDQSQPDDQEIEFPFSPLHSPRNENFAPKDLSSSKNLSDTKLKELFLAKLAEKHFMENDLDKALEVICKIYSDTKTKENLLIKLAEEYLRKDDLDNALLTINKISKDTKKKDLVSVKLMERCYQLDEINKLVEVIECYFLEVLHALMFKESMNQLNKNAFIVPDLLLELRQLRQVQSDSKKLTEQYYPQILDKLQTGGLEKALSEIRSAISNYPEF